MPRRLTPFLLLPLLALPLQACSDDGPTAAAPDRPSAYTAPAEPVDGELIRQQYTATVYLSFGRVLYGVPDPQTLRACAGGREKVIRDVSYLPAWERRTLPSAGEPKNHPHGRAWLFGDRPVQVSGDPTVWAIVGCVKSPIASGSAYQAIYGDQDWSRIQFISSGEFAALPTGPIAAAVPLRRAGNLLESGGTVTWVTYHAGSLGIESPQIMDSYCRGWSEMFSDAAEYNAHVIKGILHPGPGRATGCIRGDNYPWRGQTGTTPYAYPYGQCTSFAAWRLNEDGIEFHNQYKNVHFSDAHTWDDRAISAKIPVDGNPRVGDIAVWDPGVAGASTSGHVAYVSAVHNDGTVTVEEYNWATRNGYGTRPVSKTGLKFIHFHR